MSPQLSVRHIRQEEASGCLAACAQMALDYTGIRTTQQELNRILLLTEAGVPASRIQLLNRFDVEVIYASGDDTDLCAAVDRDLPAIVFLFTGDLPYWSANIRHAVLVVGYDDANIYLDDPVFADSPQTVSWGDFMLAWSEFDYRYALLRLPDKR